MKRTFPQFLFLSALLGVVAGVGCSQPGKRLDNVVIIVIDTLRQDHLGLYDYERNTSPNMDRLGREGAFADGVSPTSWTKPATASLLSGLHPLRHQAVNFDDRLTERVVTMAEVLRAHGHTTLGFSANGWVNPKFGLDQGFDTFVMVQRKPGPGPTIAEELNKRVLPRLQDLMEPYFLYIHYVDPHAPYDPPIAWDSGPLGEGLSKWCPLDDSILHAGSRNPRPEEMMSAAIDLYDGEIRYVDREISVVLGRLEELGLMESTLTIVTSDHGEEFEDHLRIGHGRTLYEEVTRVPLIFHAPGIIPAGTSLGSVNLIDVAPTVLEILGVQPTRADDFETDGISVAASLLDGVPFSQKDHLLHLDNQNKSSLGLLRGDHKLILEQRTMYGKRLFDVEKDPGERENLFAKSDFLDISAEMSDGLADEYNRLSSVSFSGQSTIIDSKTRASLRAMGYIDLEEEPEPRSIPAAISPADQYPGGLLGWEDLSSVSSCVQMASPGSDEQLLYGWGRPEPDDVPVGRWSHQYATFVINVPADPTKRFLHIEGNAIGHERFTIRVRSEGRILTSEFVRNTGHFEIHREMPEWLEPGVALMIVEIDPPWKPQRLWDQQDWLGAFFKSICFAN